MKRLALTCHHCRMQFSIPWRRLRRGQLIGKLRCPNCAKTSAYIESQANPIIRVKPAR